MWLDRVMAMRFSAFQDSPWPEYDAASFVLPSYERAKFLVKHYFEFALPTYRFLHRPSVERLLEGLYSDRTNFVQYDRSAWVLLYMVMAIASRYFFPDVPDVNSVEFYQAEGRQLEKEKVLAKLSRIQCRLLICIYCAATSRIK